MSSTIRKVPSYQVPSYLLDNKTLNCEACTGIGCAVVYSLGACSLSEILTRKISSVQI